MFEFRVATLKPGDEFTHNDGESWETVKECKPRPGKRHFRIVTGRGQELEFKGDDTVIVR